ncbi:hypothetical protein [Streptomyces rishiriensis]|uniref:Purine nucleoside permease n=1 Tax=Streptomyces rishiriensis TaxID=68264 RepID=A0ABU0NNC9_STRRH|nr:hypothetical protein [Streptomyces rishiriensis]MDQ0580637.1 purine nucleoside permease [Streptomyces rishiriensis]
MRIRSVLAATVLGIALAATGATSAIADEGPRQHHEEPREHHHFDEDEGVCSPYVGAIDTVSADIFWAGAHCDRF